MSKNTTFDIKTKNLYTYYGSKVKVAPLVWQKLGNPNTYIEPFLGSGAVFLARPDYHRWWTKYEIINDLNCFIINFWRAVKYAPDDVAFNACDCVNEIDYNARHLWLMKEAEKLREKLLTNPKYYDAEIAGWWVYGITISFGLQWCSGDGNKFLVEENGEYKIKEDRNTNCNKVYLNRPDVLFQGGIFLLDKKEKETPENLREWWDATIRRNILMVSNRLRSVKVLCGDWKRALTKTFLTRRPPVGIFLDPPYSQDMRCEDLYAEESACAREVLEWCKEFGHNENLRIALCGYEGEHNELEELGWEKVAWVGHAGYCNWGNGNGKRNRFQERIWFSPHCIKQEEVLISGGENE